MYSNAKIWTTTRSGAHRRFSLQPVNRALYWLWNTNFRKEHISWTRFREKRLTVRGFMTCDLNARLRIYLYLSVLVYALLGFFLTSYLTRIACTAIETASLPTLTAKVAHYQQSVQIKALQHSLIGIYDVDKNGKLSATEAAKLRNETGLSADELTASSQVVDFNRLLSAAHDRHALPAKIIALIPSAYQLSNAELNRTVRRLNTKAGLQAYNQASDAMWKDVNIHLSLRLTPPRDFLKLETWQRGATHFFGDLYSLTPSLRDSIRSLHQSPPPVYNR